MAYDEYLADRIRRILKDKKIVFHDKKMMGGLVFMVNGKMLCGIHIDKKLGDSLLMARVGEAAYEEHIDRKECLPMDFTGRPMRGFTFVTREGMDSEGELEHWIQLALDFNPLAKQSKKKK